MSTAVVYRYGAELASTRLEDIRETVQRIEKDLEKAKEQRKKRTVSLLYILPSDALKLQVSSSWLALCWRRTCSSGDPNHRPTFYRIPATYDTSKTTWLATKRIHDMWSVHYATHGN